MTHHDLRILGVTFGIPQICPGEQCVKVECFYYKKCYLQAKFLLVVNEHENTRHSWRRD